MKDMSHNATLDSAARIKQQYQNQYAVDLYSGYFVDTPGHKRKNQREKRCVAKALAGVPRGAKVLDLPCGAGRMYPLLKELGFHVTSSDSSAQMVDYAREFTEKTYPQYNRQEDVFRVADIFNTGFADKQFDAVLCGRLFHHFLEPDTRKRALMELRRICRGSIVVSFFSTVATDALKFYYKTRIKGRPALDRVPISPRTFAREIRSCGLKIDQWILARPLFSMQWYVVLHAD